MSGLADIIRFIAITNEQLDLLRAALSSFSLPALLAQLCEDAHLSKKGSFHSVYLRVVFHHLKAIPLGAIGNDGCTSLGQATAKLEAVKQVRTVYKYANGILRSVVSCAVREDCTLNTIKDSSTFSDQLATIDTQLDVWFFEHQAILVREVLKHGGKIKIEQGPKRDDVMERVRMWSVSQGIPTGKQRWAPRAGRAYREDDFIHAELKAIHDQFLTITSAAKPEPDFYKDHRDENGLDEYGDDSDGDDTTTWLDFGVEKISSAMSIMTVPETMNAGEQEGDTLVTNLSYRPSPNAGEGNGDIVVTNLAHRSNLIVGERVEEDVVKNLSYRLTPMEASRSDLIISGTSETPNHPLAHLDLPIRIAQIHAAPLPNRNYTDLPIRATQIQAAFLPNHPGTRHRDEKRKDTAELNIFME